MASGLNLQSVRMHLGEDLQVTDERLNQAIQALDAAIRNIRVYILNLRPRRLQDKNLLNGMRGMVREFSANTLINVELDGSEEEVADLSADNAMALVPYFSGSAGQYCPACRSRPGECARLAG